MIKDKKRKEKFLKSLSKVVLEYIRTILVSFLIAAIFTIILSMHARNEMIKNIYVNPEERQKYHTEIAKKLISQSDLLDNLHTRKYEVCLQVGNLYEAAQDYTSAQYAFALAVKKAPAGVYSAYQKLACIMIEQEDFKGAESLLKSVKDTKNKGLIKFKTRSYIVMGDKYYSKGKFLSAARSYEKAKFYYDRFTKKDKTIDEEIRIRIVNAYIETADLMVKNGKNSDAVRFLKKAEKYAPDSFEIKYKLAIVYSDLDPVKAVDYFEPLLDEKPQHIDYNVYSSALMKAANIADFEGKSTQAKYYRYKIHSIDIFVNQKVVYKDDIETFLDTFSVKKRFFKYKLKAKYHFQNISGTDIKMLKADFVLRQGDKIRESVTVNCANKQQPFYSNGGVTDEINVVFGKNIFTKKELEQYVIDIYLYKNDKYKTLVYSMKVPLKSVNNLP